MLRSSYLNKLDYSDIFKTVLFSKQCKTIVEIGILDGYSLETIIHSCPTSQIKAYDIFDEFNGNSADKEYLIEKFHHYDNISIDYGNFFDIHMVIENNSLDLLHVDIANNGETIQFIFDNYMQKMHKNGIIIIEGGSVERDNVEWMLKYDKQPIKPVLDNYKTMYDIITIGEMPSITLIKQKN